MTRKARAPARRAPSPAARTRLLQRLLEGALGKVFPAYQALVTRRGETVFRAAGGKAGTLAVDDQSVFDLASLTKPLVTATVAMHLAATERLPLDVPVSELLGRPTGGGAGLTPRRLLAHSSGLPAWRPFHLEILPARDRPPETRRAQILEAALATKREVEPGSAAIYSDVGFLALTALLEAIGKERLDRLFARLWPDKRLFFRELSRVRDDRRTSVFVPTEDDPVRGLLAGRVDDENAFAMGGIAGHAGLFGGADGVAALASALVEAWHGRSDLVPQPVVRHFWSRAGEPAGTTRTLGWDTPSATGSSAGANPPEGAVGHLGFTGTSCWIDPANEIVAVLLTNRVWPDRANDSIRAFRPRFHDAVWAMLL